MVLSLVVVLALAQDSGISAQPNIPPSLLTSADVDDLMWPIVTRLNRSGWLWTTESCQGHDDGRPFVLGVVTDYPSRLFALLADASTGGESFESQDPQGLTIELRPWRHPRMPLGHYQFRFIVRDVKKFPEARQVFARVAVAASPGLL